MFLTRNQIKETARVLRLKSINLEEEYRRRKEDIDREYMHLYQACTHTDEKGYSSIRKVLCPGGGRAYQCSLCGFTD